MCLPLELFAPLFINEIVDLLSQNTSTSLFSIPDFKLLTNHLIQIASLIAVLHDTYYSSMVCFAIQPCFLLNQETVVPPNRNT